MDTLFFQTLFKYEKNIIQLVYIVKLLAGIQIVFGIIYQCIYNFNTQHQITVHFCNYVSHISHTERICHFINIDLLAPNLK